MADIWTKMRCSVIVSLLVALFSCHTATSQWNVPWGKIDTITTGNSDDFDAVLQHRSNYGEQSRQWLFFARHTLDEWLIAGTRFSEDNGRWDSVLTVVSRTPAQEEQRLPDYVSSSYFVIDTNITLRKWGIVAWQRQTNDVWNIWYSRMDSNNTMFLQPQPLTMDTVDNTNVSTLAFRDSMAIAVWKRKNALLFSRVTPSTIGPTDTLAVSAVQTFEYTALPYRVVWTSVDSAGRTLMCARNINAYPQISLSEPETLFTFGAAWNPYLVFGWYSEGLLLFDADTVGGRDVFAWSGDYWPEEKIQNFSADPNADDSHARGFFNPVITKTSGALQPSWFPYDVIVMEKNNGRDSALVFFWEGVWTDTLKSRGHNRNVCIGSDVFYWPNANVFCIHSAWESNRTGRSHLYGRTIVVPWGDVNDKESIPQAFELQQNYPNPFNPNTTIRFQAGRAEHVTLKVYDLLGREITVLWDGDVSPDMYTFPWNATRFPTGVYFAKLTAGPFMACRKLLLLR